VRQFSHRTLTVSGVATAGVSAAALLLSAAPASAAAAAPVTGGHSEVAVSGAFRSALASHNVTLAATGKATYAHHTLKLPITGGVATIPTYGLNYAGGFTLTSGGVTVTVTKLKIANKTQKVTGVINGKRRINVFVNGLPQNGNGGPGDVSFGGYTVALAGAAVTSFDTKLSTTVFAKHTAVGTGETTVKYKA
jgi:hypothetical protein